MEERAEVRRETLDVKEAAAKLGVSIFTIYDLVRKKQIPHARVARRILFRSQVLDSWISQQEQQNLRTM